MSSFLTTITPADALNHLWQSSVFGCLILLLLLACRRLPARTRVALGSLGLLKFLVPSGPLLALLNHLLAAWRGNVEDVTPVLNLDLSPPLLSLPSSIVPAETSPATGVTPVEALLWVWGAGCLAIAVYLCVRGYRRYRELAADCTPAPALIEKRIMELALRLGLTHRIACSLSEAGHGPVAQGISTPRIVLPARLPDLLSGAELDAVLLHECVHLQRRDNVRSLVQAAVFSLFWFNPVVWQLCRSVRIDTEKDCDEQVVAVTSDPSGYVAGIVKTARHAIGLPQAGFSLAATPPLSARIHNILTGRHWNSRWLRGGVITLAASLFALSGQAGSFAVQAVSASRTPVAPVTQTNPAPTVVAEIPAQTPADAPAIAPVPEIAAAAATEPVAPAPITPDPAPIATPTAPTPQPVEAEPVKASEPVSSEPSPALSAPEPAKPTEPAEPTPLLSKELPSAEPSKSDVAHRAVTIDSVPTLIGKLDVKYPYAMKRQGIIGEVLVGFIVDPSGSPRDVKVVRSSRKEFEEAAVNAIAKSRYTPGVKGGRVVSTRMQVPIRFNISSTRTTGSSTTSRSTSSSSAGSKNADQTYAQSQLDRQPKLLDQSVAQPDIKPGDYPNGASARVNFILDEQGVPTEITVPSASSEAFGRACMAAAAKWRFEPGLKDGKPVKVRMLVPLSLPKKS